MAKITLNQNLNYEFRKITDMQHNSNKGLFIIYLQAKQKYALEN